MTVDPKRGDIEIELVTETGKRRGFVLRPSFEAIVEIEEQTGWSIFALARRLAKAELGHHEVACVVGAGLKAAGEAVSYDAVGEMMLRTGLADVLPPVGEFLAKVLGGFGSAEHTEAAPQPAKETTSRRQSTTAPTPC